MTTKTILASLAASSLVLATPAAASTRSFESLPANGVQLDTTVERGGTVISEEEDLRGRRSRSIWIIAAALGLTALLVALLTNGKSPG